MTSSNPVLRRSAVMLERAAKANKAKIWETASEKLAAPAALRVEVNVGHISKMAESGGVFFVPGKVLGSGDLDKKLVVGAFAFSASAKKKILSNGGSVMSIEQFLKKYPKGSGVRIVE
jgi:large subunit ribosomal protein L18e